MPLSSVIGNAPLIALLRKAAARDRVPQSLIFAGPDGVGKRTTAIGLAQALNCPNRKDGDGCGTCPACARIARGQHSDVTIVDRGEERSIKIRVLRERVIESMGFRPFEAPHRIYIIDPADDLTVEAQDALLKTLEEPPPAAIIILITAYPDTLLPTIQSRCRRLRFGLLTEADVARVLVERQGLDRAKAQRLAASAGGSVSRALAEEGDDFEDDVNAALAVVTAARTPALGPRLKAAAALAQHGSSRRDRDALGERLAIVQSLLRDLSATRISREVGLTHIDMADTLRDLAPAFDMARLSAAFEAVDRAAHALERNASPKIIADWVAVSI